MPLRVLSLLLAVRFLTDRGRSRRLERGIGNRDAIKNVRRTLVCRRGQDWAQRQLKFVGHLESDFVSNLLADWRIRNRSWLRSVYVDRVRIGVEIEVILTCSAYTFGNLRVSVDRVAGLLSS